MTGGSRIREHLTAASYKDQDGYWKHNAKVHLSLRKKCIEQGLDPQDTLKSIYCNNGLLKLKDIGIDFNILDQTNDPVESESLEAKWSHYYDSFFNGWNTATTFVRHTTYKHIMGDNHYTRKYGSPFKGQTQSDAARKLISRARRGQASWNKGKTLPEMSEHNRRTWKIPEVREKRSKAISLARIGQGTYGANPRARKVKIEMTDGEILIFDCKKRLCEFLGVSNVMVERYLKENIKPKRYKVPRFKKIEYVEVEKNVATT
jgi:hypothetical protein